MTERIEVGGPSPYAVLVGNRDVLGQLPRLLSGAAAAAVVHQPSVQSVAKAVADACETRAELIQVPDGEAAKTATHLAELWDAFAGLGIGRTDAVVAVGGGAVTDLAGFAAASWLRGVRVAHVPTTLLGMVDAAVGGKTGIDTAAGKNLVGAFHPPTGVLCDLSTLDTLPPEELASGLAEVAKAGFIADPVILQRIEDDPRAHLAELVTRSIRVKAEVVSVDLREAGRREILNYGHTLGHAIERVENYRIRHGYAISIGMVYAAELARLAGRLGPDLVDRHRSVLRSIGLPTDYPRDRWADLRAVMQMDKKARAGRIRFVILDGVGRPVMLEDPAESLLEAAYAEVSR